MLQNVSRAFTLVELMVVIAVISTLAAIAIPAYNNYTAKSKFAEVVLAAGPAKTAISTCAVSGDCIKANAISLGGSAGAGGSNASATEDQLNDQGHLLLGGCGITNFETAQNMVVMLAENGNTIITDPDNGSNVCYSGDGSTCEAVCANDDGDTLTSVQNPYATPGGDASPAFPIPCVGTDRSCSPPTKYAASVTHSDSGVITATAQASSGLSAETLVLTPGYSGGRVDWSASGTCKTREGGSIC